MADAWNDLVRRRTSASNYPTKNDPSLKSTCSAEARAPGRGDKAIMPRLRRKSRTVQTSWPRWSRKHVGSWNEINALHFSLLDSVIPNITPLNLANDPFISMVLSRPEMMDSFAVYWSNCTWPVTFKLHAPVVWRHRWRTVVCNLSLQFMSILYLSKLGYITKNFQLQRNGIATGEQGEQHHTVTLTWMTFHT